MAKTGICTPGFNLSVCLSQRPNESTSFASMPAARLKAPADVGEVGADDAGRRGCRGSRWQAPQPVAKKSFAWPLSRELPRWARRRGRGLGDRASARSHRALSIDFDVVNAISACEAPQYSAQAPRKTPRCGVGREIARCVTRPGIMSILPASDGTQNEWMTSTLSRWELHRLPHRQADLVGEATTPRRREADSVPATTTARRRRRSGGRWGARGPGGSGTGPAHRPGGRRGPRLAAARPRQ